MKDGALKACVGMGFIVSTYAVYMLSHVCAGLPPPDGAVFATVFGAVCALAGYGYAKKPS